MDERQKLLFSVRKYLGISQAQMAKLFGLSQSKIARAELGKTPLWDHEWNRFIKQVNASENSIITDCSNLNQLYKKIHHVERNSFTPSVKMRSIATTVKFVKEELGREKELQEVFSEVGVFDKYQNFLDFNVNPLLFEQTANIIFENKIITMDDYEHLTLNHMIKEIIPEKNWDLFSNKITPFQRLKESFKNPELYVDYHQYSYREYKDKMIIYLNYKIPREYQMISICEYETSYLEVVANYGLSTPACQVIKDKCYFRGDDHCSYIARL
ncbi:MAG: helix-turn-helix domain-containing protein [Bacteriovoracaceae bacterium]